MLDSSYGETITDSVLVTDLDKVNVGSGRIGFTREVDGYMTDQFVYKIESL